MKYTQALYISYFGTIVVSSLLLLPSFAFASEGHLDWTNFTYRILNLLFFVGIIYVLAGKKIRAFFKERRQSIYDDFEIIAKEKEEVQQSLKEIKEKMKRLEEERTAILVRAEEDALAMRRKMLEEAEHEVQRIIQDAYKKMVIEQEKVKQELIVEIADRIYQQVEHTLQTTLTPSLQKEIIDSSIQKVVTFEKEITSKTLC